MWSKSVSAPHASDTHDTLHYTWSGDDTRPGNASDYLLRPELLVSGHYPPVPECPGYFCTVSIFCTRPVSWCRTILQYCRQQLGLRLEDEAALKLLDDAVCVTWCNSDPALISGAVLTLASPHRGLRDLGASTCLASQQRVSGRDCSVF